MSKLSSVDYQMTVGRKVRLSTHRERLITSSIFISMICGFFCYATGSQLEWFLNPVISAKETVKDIRKEPPSVTSVTERLCWTMIGDRLRTAPVTASYTILYADNDRDGIWRALNKVNGEGIGPRDRAPIGPYRFPVCVSLPSGYAKVEHLKVIIHREYKGFRGWWDLEAPEVTITWHADK